ncbi:MAG: protein translocase subunit SecF [Candidatus Latescibacteria bacterium]|nr:protein translocase subunit SecF [Candidatus Latescibacterota bacterium]
MLQLFKSTDFNFTGRRYFAFAFSVLLIILTIVSLVVHRGVKYGVDFAGGTLLELKFSSPITTANLRSVFRNFSMGSASIQQFGEGYDFIVRFESEGIAEAAESTSIKVIELLKQAIPDNTPEIVRIEIVGPRIGKELQRNAILAILIGIFGILIYVSIRFDFRLGTAAVIALIQDVLIAIGFISITRTEISIPIIAALLTIVGYSVNNSIVISDRIRENLRKMHKVGFEAIINRSINDTLSRTVLTALSTFVVALMLWIFGAAAIKDFARIISFGIILGTYSTIFIAAPLVVEWEKRFPSRRRR